MISAVNGSTAPISPANNRQDAPAGNARIETALTQTESGQEQSSTVTPQAISSSNATDRQQEFREQENTQRQSSDPVAAPAPANDAPEPVTASPATAISANSNPQPSAAPATQQQNALQQQLEQVGRPEREPNFETQA